MPKIDDIILKKKSGNEFFNTYKPVKEIGEKILKSFMKIYTPEKGFPISQKDLRYGTLTNAIALSTLLDLENMGVDISKYQDKFRFTLKTLFDNVYKNGYLSTPVFDATPYLDENSEKFDSYVETAAKILIVMIDLRNYAHKNAVRNVSFGEPIILANKTISSFAELAVIAERLLIDSTEFLNNSVLSVKENEIKIRKIENKDIVRDHIPPEIKYRGWTFCPPENESEEYSTSIYYTYHVTNAFVSFYNAYPDIFDKIFYDSNDNEYGLQALNDAEKSLHAITEEFILKNKSVINEFRNKVASSGRYIESLLSEKGVNIALDFVKSDFTGISFSNVINTQDRNAVINTLFILAIYLNAGIDEDYEFLSQKEFVAKNKDWFYNQLQFAISNIKKIYSVLKVENKQEIIDSFNLHASLLNEKFPSHQSVLVQQLRKGCRNVSVYDLIPLLCNTYAIVFEYIINYPQLDMVDNLELIMENCSKDGEWLWGDIDGFNINNNLYYIVALENFYDYYKNYEEQLSGNQSFYKKIVKDKEDDFKKRLNEEKKKNEALEEQNRQLEVALEEKRSNLDKEVEALAKNMFDKLFEDSMTDYLDKMLTDATGFYIDAFTANKTPSQVMAAFKNDKRLRVALALYSYIDFGKVAFGSDADFTLLSKLDGNGNLTKEYMSKMTNQLNLSIADNVDIKNNK